MFKQIALLSAGALLSGGCVVAVRNPPPPPPTPVVIYTDAPAPAPVVQVIPPRPYYGAVWVRGYWVRRPHRWVWVPGYYR